MQICKTKAGRGVFGKRARLGVEGCRRFRGGRHLCVARLLLGVDVPYDVVGKADHFVSCPLSHFGKPFRLGLVLECIAREINSWQKLSFISTDSMGAKTYRTDGHRP